MTILQNIIRTARAAYDRAFPLIPPTCVDCIVVQRENDDTSARCIPCYEREARW